MHNPFAREQYVTPPPPEGKASDVPLPEVPPTSQQEAAPVSSTPDLAPVEAAPTVSSPAPQSQPSTPDQAPQASTNTEWSDGAKLMAEKGEAQARDKDTGA